MISIFTPTYNRKNELMRVYESLLKQDSKLFEWIIVDDGSNDGTEDVVSNWLIENKINIKYIKQKNMGKCMAFNRGVQEAAGDFFVCCDSDDRLKENIISVIYEKYSLVKDKEDIAGFGFLNSRFNTNEIVGTKYPHDGMVCNYYDIYYKYHVKGDKQLMFKTKILRETPFPKFDNEKFVPEALVFLRIAKKYNMIFYNIIGQEVEYQEGGYTNHYFSLVMKNPKGNMQYFLELFEFSKRLYDVYGYILFGIYAGVNVRELIKNHPAKIKLLLLYLPTRVMALVKRRKK